MGGMAAQFHFFLSFLPAAKVPLRRRNCVPRLPRVLGGPSTRTLHEVLTHRFAGKFITAHSAIVHALIDTAPVQRDSTAAARSPWATAIRAFRIFFPRCRRASLSAHDSHECSLVKHAEWIGWASSCILLITLMRQVYTQWRTRTDAGVSQWLFIGQVTASIGFAVYSVLLGNWVFIVSNVAILCTAFVGQYIYLHNKSVRRKSK
jgi:MtN3 and saliva related transmembrane protein